MSCCVMSCLVMSCHVMSCHVMSCHVDYDRSFDASVQAFDVTTSPQCCEEEKTGREGMWAGTLPCDIPLSRAIVCSRALCALGPLHAVGPLSLPASPHCWIK